MQSGALQKYTASHHSRRHGLVSPLHSGGTDVPKCPGLLQRRKKRCWKDKPQLLTRASTSGISHTSKTSKLATLAATALVEFAISGGLFWSPLLCALLFIILSPSAASQQQQQDEAVQQAVEQARREMEKRMPVTPPESASWMNRMMAEIWGPFVVPQMLKENLSAWQEKVRGTAPQGWDIDLVDMSMGHDSPIMSNYQIFNDPATGKMSAMECDMVMDSKSMRVVVRGSGPLGSFTATVYGVTMKGRMRVLPIPDQRMLLWSYLSPPDATVRLQVKGPLIGERDVPQFSFIKEAFKASIKDSLVEPRRAAASLDYEYLVQQAVNTNINIYLESIDGLSTTEAASTLDEAAGSIMSSASKTGNLIASASKSLLSTAVTPAAASKAASATATGNAVLGAAKSGSDASAGGDRKQAKAGSKPSGNAASSKQDSSVQTDTSSLSSSVATPSNSTSSSGGGGALTSNRQQAARSPLSRLRRRSAVHVYVTNMDTKLQRKSATRVISLEGRVSLNELIKLELGGKEGIIELSVRDASRSKVLLGRALIHVMATKDGCTLMWALGPHNEPLALRWQPAMGPWRLTLPLEGAPGASLTLGLSADPWAYKAALLPAAAYRTPGPRTVVMQIMESRDLAAKDWAGTSDPYAQITYSGATYRTRTIYNSLRPVWAQTFVFLENPSLLARRVGLEIWDSGVSRDESLGYSSINLDLAIENAIQDRWYQLSGEESGDVRVRLTVVPGQPDSPAVSQMVALLSSQYTQASMSTLQVVVVAARGLMPRPAALSLLGSQRNAYASISFAGARQVTPVIRDSNAPTWNHSSLFPLDLNLNKHAPHSSSHSTGSANALLTGNAGVAGAGGSSSATSSSQSEVKGDGHVVNAVSASTGQHVPGQINATGGTGGHPHRGTRHDSTRTVDVTVESSKSSSSPSSSHAAGQPGSAGASTGATRDTPSSSSTKSDASKNDGKKRVPWPLPAGISTPAQPTAEQSKGKDQESNTLNTMLGVVNQLSVANVSSMTETGMSNAADGLRTFAQGFMPAGGAFGTAISSNNNTILKIQVMDVDPMPPDDDLGVAELDVAKLISEPGSIWEQWIPLKEGGTGEVLVRLAHLAPAVVSGALPLPSGVNLSSPMDEATAAAFGAPRPATDPAALASSTTASKGSGNASVEATSGFGQQAQHQHGPGSGTDTKQQGSLTDPVAGLSIDPALVNSAMEQLQAAQKAMNATIAAGEDLRVKLGQDWIPKVTDWWSKAAKQAQASVNTTLASALATSTSQATPPIVGQATGTSKTNDSQVDNVQAESSSDVASKESSISDSQSTEDVNKKQEDTKATGKDNKVDSSTNGSSASTDAAAPVAKPIDEALVSELKTIENVVVALNTTPVGTQVHKNKDGSLDVVTTTEGAASGATGNAGVAGVGKPKGAAGGNSSNKK